MHAHCGVAADSIVMQQVINNQEPSDSELIGASLDFAELESGGGVHARRRAFRYRRHDSVLVSADQFTIPVIGDNGLLAPRAADVLASEA